MAHRSLPSTLATFLYFHVQKLKEALTEVLPCINFTRQIVKLTTEILESGDITLEKVGLVFLLDQ